MYQLEVISTDIFDTIKNNITTREAAEKYGISVGRNGMCVCPFHDDHNPSMKVDKRFHCFGCQADGDVINFTARLYKLSQMEAALKLCADFEINLNLSESHNSQAISSAFTEKQLFNRDVATCYNELINYYHQLRGWLNTYEPKKPSDEWDSHFVEAITNISVIDVALDVLLFGTDDEKRSFLDEYREKGIPHMEQNHTPIYYASSTFAREQGELELFRASHQENVACKKDIEETISRNFDGMYLQREALTDVLSRHDPERVKLVLASTLQDKSWDGRFSFQNKEWAASIRMPNTASDLGFDRRYEYSIGTHPAVLDGFVTMFRKEMAEREKSSVIIALQKPSTKPEKTTKSKEKEACL